MRVIVTIACVFLSSFLFSQQLPHLSEMTIEEKVGQLLMVYFHGSTCNEEAKTFIKKNHVGSIIYYNWSNGLDSPLQIQTLSASLQELAKSTRLQIPLIISVDQEGGIVTRLDKGFTLFPGNKALGMTHEPTLARESSYIMGKEMKAVGINLVLGPVVDINSEPKNPVIGLRSFGQTAKEVTCFGKQSLKGFHDAQIATCIKHYPGHGAVRTDSHYDLPQLSKDFSSLKKEDLAPFRQLASQTDCVMTGHINALALDEGKCATLSKKTISYLKNQLKFKGAVISDSLAMQGVLKAYNSNIPEVAVEAINAGCDILCLGGKELIYGVPNSSSYTQAIEAIYNHIVLAVKQGIISEKRLNDAVKRVFRVKKQLFYLEPNALKLTPINFTEQKKPPGNFSKNCFLGFKSHPRRFNFIKNPCQTHCRFYCSNDTGKGHNPYPLSPNWSTVSFFLFHS